MRPARVSSSDGPPAAGVAAQHGEAAVQAESEWAVDGAAVCVQTKFVGVNLHSGSFGWGNSVILWLAAGGWQGMWAADAVQATIPCNSLY